jgi:hypothetical protein
MLSQPIEPSAEMEADSRARLVRVCGRYSPEEFTALVRQIAMVRTKYEAIHVDAFLSAARALGIEQNGGDRHR